MFKKTLTAIIAATTLFGFTSANANEATYYFADAQDNSAYDATANKVFEKNPNFENELNFIERTLLPIYL